MIDTVSIKELYSIFKNRANARVCTDTRKIIPGSIFFALKGENFDGNAFALDAIKRGCVGAVVSDPSLGDNSGVYFVPDTLKALQDLAREHRRYFHFPVIGIGGSNGKTTHKELMHAVLSKKFRCKATRGNLNNHIGVPLTLLETDAQSTEILVLEMGANHQGEYTELCEIADPDYGLLTNIGRDHLEGFGGYDGVVKGNAELYDYLRIKKRKIFLNLEDALLKELSLGMDIIGYGNHPNALVQGWVESEDPLTICWRVKGNTSNFLLPTHFVGAHYLPNILSALCAGIYWGVKEEDMQEAISSYIPSMNRSQKIRTQHNELLMDAYNANPDSMRAAIDSFLTNPSTEKWIILGDMFELGLYASEEHQALCDYLKNKNFINVYLVGPIFSACNTSFKKFQSTSDLKEYLKKNPPEGKYILLKGSRGMRLEEIKEVL